MNSSFSSSLYPPPRKNSTTGKDIGKNKKVILRSSSSIYLSKAKKEDKNYKDNVNNDICKFNIDNSLNSSVSPFREINYSLNKSISKRKTNFSITKDLNHSILTDCSLVTDSDLDSKKLFRRFYDKFSDSIENCLIPSETKNNVQLIGNQRFRKSSVETFLNEKKQGSLYNKFNPQYKKDIEVLQNIDQNAINEQEDNTQLLRQYRDKKAEILNKFELTPLPLSVKGKGKEDVHQESLIYKANRSAVIMRRFEYDFELSKRRSIEKRRKSEDVGEEENDYKRKSVERIKSEEIEEQDNNRKESVKIKIKNKDTSEGEINNNIKSAEKIRKPEINVRGEINNNKKSVEKIIKPEIITKEEDNNSHAVGIPLIQKLMMILRIQRVWRGISAKIKLNKTRILHTFPPIYFTKIIYKKFDLINSKKIPPINFTKIIYKNFDLINPIKILPVNFTKIIYKNCDLINPIKIPPINFAQIFYKKFDLIIPKMISPIYFTKNIYKKFNLINPKKIPPIYFTKNISKKFDLINPIKIPPIYFTKNIYKKFDLISLNKIPPIYFTKNIYKKFDLINPIKIPPIYFTKNIYKKFDLINPIKIPPIYFTKNIYKKSDLIRLVKIQPIYFTKKIYKKSDLIRLVKIQAFKGFLRRLKEKKRIKKNMISIPEIKIISIPKIKNPFLFTITRKISLMPFIIKLQNNIKKFIKNIKFHKAKYKIKKIMLRNSKYFYFFRLFIVKLFGSKNILRVIVNLKRNFNKANMIIKNNKLDVLKDKLLAWKRQIKKMIEIENVNRDFNLKSIFNSSYQYKFQNNLNNYVKKLSFDFMSSSVSSKMKEVESKKIPTLTPAKDKSPFMYENNFNFDENNFPLVKIISYKFESRSIHLLETTIRKHKNSELAYLNFLVTHIKNILQKNLLITKTFIFEKIKSISDVSRKFKVFENKITYNLKLKFLIKLSKNSVREKLHILLTKYFKFLLFNSITQPNLKKRLNKIKLSLCINKIAKSLYKKECFNKILLEGIYQTSDKRKANILIKMMQELTNKKNVNNKFKYITFPTLTSFNSFNIFDFIEEYSRVIRGFGNEDLKKIRENRMEIQGLYKKIDKDIGNKQRLRVFDNHQIKTAQKVNSTEIKIRQNSSDNSLSVSPIKGNNNHHYLVLRNETMTLLDFEDHQKYKNSNLNTSKFKII